MAYVPDPKAKGLDVLVAGWAAAAVPDARLEVYGIEPEWARSHLQRSGVPEPASISLLIAASSIGCFLYRRPGWAHE